MANTANSQTAAQILAGGKNAGGQPLSSVQQSVLQKQVANAAPKPAATSYAQAGNPTVTPTAGMNGIPAKPVAPVANAAPKPSATPPPATTPAATTPPATSTAVAPANPTTPAATTPTGDTGTQPTDPNNPLANTPEYQMQQFLNKPVMDYFNNQKQLEGQKLVDMQKLLDTQSQQDMVMVNDQINSIQSSASDNLSLLSQQKDQEAKILDDTRASRSADLAQQQQDASDQMDQQIRDQQEQVIDQEAQARTALGLTGGFGSQARLDQISTAVSKGNDVVAKLQIAKAKLSIDFAKQADQITRDYSNGMQDVMFKYDQNLLSIKKQASDQIMDVKKQALSTKQQKDAQYAQIKSDFFDNLSKIEGNTANLMAQTNKDTYAAVIQAHKDELDRQQKSQEDQFNRATKLIDMYGGVNGAILAEKMLGLPDGTLPRVQTTDEAKTQLQYLQFQSDNYFKTVGMQMDAQKLKLQQDQFGWDTGSYQPGQYDQLSTAPGGGVIGQKSLDTAWDKVPASIKGNCVAFARSVVPDFPMVGVSETSHKVNADGKRSAINSKVPVPGSIAIMPDRGFYGHVAYVESVNQDGTITVVDANDPSGKGMQGSAQVLSAGGKGVGGVPGIRRKIVDPTKNGIEGYYVGKGALTEPMHNPNMDKSELLNGSNDTEKDDQYGKNQQIVSNLSNMLPGNSNLNNIFLSSITGAMGWTQPGQNTSQGAQYPNLNDATSQQGGSIQDAEDAFLSSGAGSISDLQSNNFRRLKNSNPQQYMQQLQSMAQSKSQGASAKPPTQDQSVSATYAKRMTDAMSIMDNLSKTTNFTDMKYAGQRAAPTNILGISTGGFGKSDELKQQEQAERNFVNAVLRKESGATISEDEFKNAALQYFPMPGDTPQVLAQKQQNRQSALQGMMAEAGPAYQQAFGGGYTMPEMSSGNTYGGGFNYSNL